METTLIIPDDYLTTVFNNTEKLYAAQDLWYYHKKLVEAPNANLPYHNYRHMCHVTCEVYDFCKSTKVDPETFLVMLLGAIFHDYGHTGDGSIADSRNIEIAIESLSIHLHPIHAHLISRIIPFIRATEFPHKPLTNIADNTELLLAIRDADMSQSLNIVWIQQTIFGMAAEQRKTRDEMIKGQLPFLTHYLTFNTEWAKNKFAPELKKRINFVAFYIDKLYNTNYYS